LTDIKITFAEGIKAELAEIGIDADKEVQQGIETGLDAMTGDGGYEEAYLGDYLRSKMKRDNKRFWAGDNISEYLEEGFKEILSKGAVVRLCNLCLLVRGTMKNCLTKECGDVKRAGTPDLAKIIEETDRLVVIC